MTDEQRRGLREKVQAAEAVVAEQRSRLAAHRQNAREFEQYRIDVTLRQGATLVGSQRFSVRDDSTEYTDYLTAEAAQELGCPCCGRPYAEEDEW